jgi:hypothetical protein
LLLVDDLVKPVVQAVAFGRVKFPPGGLDDAVRLFIYKSDIIGAFFGLGRMPELKRVGLP